MATRPKTKSAAIREKLNHPIIDGDGHTVEYLPLGLEYLREVGGEKLRDEFISRLPAGNRNYDGPPDRIGGPKGWYGLTKQERRDMRVSRGGFWGLPTVKTLDRATVMLPDLFRERLDDLGVDFAVLYPTMGFEFQREMSNPELRIAGCRAFNKMYADLYGPHADRMTVAAIIPTTTPQEAIAEIDYAINTLGMKAIVLGTSIRRPIPEVARNAPKYAYYASWMDVLGISSEYDYDPVWQKCVDMKLAAATHSASRGWGYRNSPDSFIYNHIGHFAAANEAFCKALVIGGVVRRFPKLTFAFLEGGVGWACNLYNDLIEHWETRNIDSMRELNDPAKLDRAAMDELFAKYGRSKFNLPSGDSGVPIASHHTKEDPADLDEWQALGITDPRKFADIFQNFYFGCEAEDRMTSIAFNERLNHYGVKLQAMFSSDVGHFDVRDITTVVADAYELVEHGLIGEEDFRKFTFTNVAGLYGKMNPNFFKGTAVEGATAAVLSR